MKIFYDLFNHLGFTEMLCSFRLVLEGKAGKETLESSGLDFLEKFLADNFALSDTDYNTSGLLNITKSTLLLQSC